MPMHLVGFRRRPSPLPRLSRRSADQFSSFDSFGIVSPLFVGVKMNIARSGPPNKKYSSPVTPRSIEARGRFPDASDPGHSGRLDSSTINSIRSPRVESESPWHDHPGASSHPFNHLRCGANWSDLPVSSTDLPVECRPARPAHPPRRC